jgi:hypothetical protein
VFAGIENAGLLDFVAAWYVKAARYVVGSASADQSDSGRLKSAPQNPAPQCAFVSTNSITQGEQVGVLWGWLLAQGIKIHFAHRTFSWNNEARGKAAVHCVIIGFGREEVAENLTPTDGHCRLALQPDLRLRRNGANDKHRAAIEAAAQGVLDARAAHPGATLADLYDPLTLPGNLLKAHQLLDKAVDAAYGFQGGKDGKGGPFTDVCRVAFLFTRYQQLVGQVTK